ncbi:MAG TPA: DUF6174 domain-containing protein [Gemmatimonadaceae bacterium]
MSRSWLRLASITMTVALLSCSSATEPGTDVDFARALWLGRHPRAYTFEVAVTAFLSRPGFVRVQVSEGRVIDARDSSGQPIADYALTVDDLWDDLLLARARNELNSAKFSLWGVPTEVDVGELANDSGRHYSVRNFAVSR